MGAGNGNKDCISITNHSAAPIIVTATDSEDKKQHTINPKDSYLFFVDRVEALSWERIKIQSS